MKGLENMSLNKKNEVKKYEDGFILPFWEKIFKSLSKISTFYLIMLMKKNITHRFVEKWVLFNLLLSIASSILIYSTGNKFLSVLFCVYGALRVFEVLIYQINVLLFDPYRANKKGRRYSIKSPTRMVILLLHNYFELVFWYSTFYLGMLVIFNIEIIGSWGTYLKISMLCFMTFDASIVEGNALLRSLSNIAFIEVISGLIMTIISLARFIGILPDVNPEEEI